jgi:outer membrane receptor protein involved in Fe transport
MKLFRKFAIILLVLQGIFGLTNAQQKAVLIGMVRDAATKEKLTGVTVYESDSTVISTDSSGKYELNLNEGSHTISFRFIGYETISKTIVLKSAEARILNVDLTPSFTELGTVVVSAGKFEQKIEDVTVSMEVLKPDLVQNSNTTSMDDAINQVPGVTVIDGQANIRGGSGFSYGAGSRVLLLVDDLPMLTADANDVKWSFLPTENLEQIEVLKGASSALFGSSAMNGVINVRTAYPKSKPETKVSLFEGVYDSPKNKLYKWWGDSTQITRGMSASHSQKFGRFDLVAAGNYFKDEGYREGENEERYRVNANTRYSFKNAFEGLAVGVNANYMHTKGALFFLWKDDSTGALIPRGGLDTATTSISDYTTIRFNIDPYVTYVSKNGETHKIRTRYFKTDNNNNTNQQSFAKLYYGEYQFQKRFSENLTWTSGVSDMYSGVKSELYGNHLANNIALFTQIDNKFNKWIFSFGARWEQNRIDTVKGEFTPVFRSGISYELFPYTHLRVSYGQGYRFPSIAEKFIRTDVGGIEIFPNDSLQPETGFSAEFGINQGLKINSWKGYADVAAFWSEYNNMMEFTFVSLPTGIGFESLNIGNVRIQGLDVTLTGDGKIGKIPITILAGYTVIYPIQTDFVIADTLNGTAGYNILKYRYRRILKSDVETKLWKFTLGASARYNSFMENIDRIFDFIIPGVSHYREVHNTGDWVFDGRIFYSFLNHYDIGFIIKNAFNRDYIDRPADLQPPRSFTVQARVKF